MVLKNKPFGPLGSLLCVYHFFFLFFSSLEILEGWQQHQNNRPHIIMSSISIINLPGRVPSNFHCK